MEIHDSLNNQFKLYNYIAKLNTNLLQYLDNNNVDINYYCFFSKVIGEKHYIITSETTKRSLNGYRLITLQDVEKDNNIFECNDNLDIIFENIHIKVTSIINNIKDVAKDLGVVIRDFGVVITNFYNKLADNSTIDFMFDYNKNILESDITNVVNVRSMRVKILSNFENLEKLNFHWSFNQMIGINELPSSLRTLTFGNHYNKKIGINVLPNSLQTLTFGNYYNRTIGVNVLPNLLKSLTFGSAYNQVIDINVLPNSLQTLTFGRYYYQIIGVNVLPNSLQVINFDFNFNYYITQCKNHMIPQAFQNIIKYIN
jgi:hypothetical protein